MREDTLLHAVIDVGSNTIRLSIFEVVAPSEEPVQVFNKKIMAGLAGYVDQNRMLSPHGITRAIECIQSHQRKIMNFNVTTVSVFATAVLRNVSNSIQAIEAIEAACNLSIEILSGEDEARLSFFGAMHALDAKQGVLFDIGGASTEIVIFKDRSIHFAGSVPHGSLNLFLGNVEAVLPTYEEQAHIAQIFQTALAQMEGLSEDVFETIYGVGGTIRGAGKLSDALYHDGAKMRKLEVTQMAEMLKDFGTPGHYALRKILSIIPDRVHTVVPGMICAYTIARRFSSSQIIVSRYGLREGYLFARVLGETVNEQH
jgi:exopolyphosphatase / guanosine-5'-triphosphate,3'-diphosphate pyrophosphatase